MSYAEFLQSKRIVVDCGMILCMMVFLLTQYLCLLEKSEKNSFAVSVESKYSGSLVKLLNQKKSIAQRPASGSRRGTAQTSYVSGAIRNSIGDLESRILRNGLISFARVSATQNGELSIGVETLT